MELYCTDAAQHLITAGEELDDIDRDPSVRRVITVVIVATSTIH